MNDICSVNDKRFRCPGCDLFIKKARNFNRHVKTCQDRIQHIYPKIAHTLRNILFDKLDGFGISYNDDQTLFENLAFLDFEYVCVPTEELKI